MYGIALDFDPFPLSMKMLNHKYSIFLYHTMCISTYALNLEQSYRSDVAAREWFMREGRLVDADAHSYNDLFDERSSVGPAANNAEQGEWPEGHREWPEIVGVRRQSRTESRLWKRYSCNDFFPNPFFRVSSLRLFIKMEMQISLYSFFPSFLPLSFPFSTIAENDKPTHPRAFYGFIFR